MKKIKRSFFWARAHVRCMMYLKSFSEAIRRQFTCVHAYVRVCVRCLRALRACVACVRACVKALLRACKRACVRTCMRACSRSYFPVDKGMSMAILAGSNRVWMRNVRKKWNM